MHPCLASALLASALCATPPSNPALQRELEALLKESGAPGASLAVILPGGQMLTATAGVSDKERGTPMRPDHRLFSGSIGKTYVAAVLLQLAAEGRLSLDDALSRYLGDQAWYPRLPNGPAITLRHLLTHSSGLPEYVEQESLWQAIAANPDRNWTPEARLAEILDAKPAFPAGQGFAYADTNYILLGMVIEQVTGRPYEQVQAERLLKPLGLKETQAANQRALPGLTAGYSALPPFFHMPPKVGVEGRYGFNPQLEWTGGGLVSTAADLARWGSALFGGKVLSDGWLKQMRTPSGQRTDMADGAEYGLGLILWQTPFGPAWGHSGFVPGFNAVLEHLPEQGVTLALMCNSDTALKRPGSSPHQAAQRLLRILPNGKAPAEPGPSRKH